MIARRAHARPRTALRLERRGSVRTRLAFAVAFVVQLLAVVVVPVAHARLARPLAAHVEGPVAPAHHTHDEASCAPCAAQHLAGTVERPAAVLPATSAPHLAIAAGAVVYVPRRVAFIAAPRAPPVS